MNQRPRGKTCSLLSASDLVAEQERAFSEDNKVLEVKLAAEKIQADLTRNLFLGNMASSSDAMACTPTRDELTADSLLDTISLFRRQHRDGIGMSSGMPMQESVHLTVSKAKWMRVRRPWRTRLFGGSLPLWRASAMLVVLLLAVTVTSWFVLALFALSLRPRRWGISRRPRKIYEQVPDLNYFVMDGMILAHPVTMAKLKAELARMQPEGAPELFTRSLNVPAPMMTRAEYRRVFGAVV